MNNYYVYELIDPRTNKTFYVGKGKHNRMYSHEIAVRSGKWDGNTAKCKLIKEIIEAGDSIGYRIVKSKLTEEDAFELEKKTIARIGLSNLTNIQSGHSQFRKFIHRALLNFFDNF